MPVHISTPRVTRQEIAGHERRDYLLPVSRSKVVCFRYRFARAGLLLLTVLAKEMGQVSLRVRGIIAKATIGSLLDCFARVDCYPSRACSTSATNFRRVGSGSVGHVRTTSCNPGSSESAPDDSAPPCVSALSFSGSLVQAQVQASKGVDVSALLSSLMTGASLLPKLVVAGSIPVSRSSSNPLTAVVSGLFRLTG